MNRSGGRTKRPRTRTGGEKCVARVCVFDVNETLLDMGALDPLFERAFGDAAARGEWFGQLQQSWLVATVTGHYEQFGTIGGTALRMVAERRGVSLPDEEGRTFSGRYASCRRTRRSGKHWRVCVTPAFASPP